MKKLHNALLLKQITILKQIGYRYTDIKLSDLESEPIQLPNDIDSLKEIVNRCHLCQLSKTRQNIVFGEGDTQAKLMFIGEAPGEMEDRMGRVFIGRAGELLTKMIENVLELKREDVYIANILKCRPPNNRVPTPTEAISCRPYILKQISLIQPKIIVTLGATAYNYLNNDKTPISKIRGHIIKHPEYIILPTFHPSYLLRNPSAKRVVFEDLLKVKELLD